MWTDAPDERAEWGIKHLLDFARYYPADPGQSFWSLSTGLDALRRHWLDGRLSRAICGRLLVAIEVAERAAMRYPWPLGEHAFAHGFPSLTLLAAAWGPEGAGAAALDRRDVRLRSAAKHARMLQNTAHSLSLLHETVNRRAVLPACCPI